MRKAVLDTNILASGVFWAGTPHQVLQAWMAGRFRWVISEEIFDEYREVLLELASGKPEVDVNRILKLVAVGAEKVRPVAFARPICTDADDDKFLGAAVAAGAEFVVSGDKALLKVGTFRQVRIVSAREFLERL